MLSDVCIKIHRDSKYSLVAICDQELIDKTFREGRVKLEKKKEFYNDRRCSIKKAIDILDRAAQANLVGNKIVNAAIKHGLIDPRAVIQIDGIPHVQIMKLDLLK